MEALAVTLRPMEVGNEFVTKLAAEATAPGKLCWGFLNTVLAFSTMTDRDLALSSATTAAKVLKDSGETGTPYSYVSSIKTIVKAAAEGFSIDDSLSWNKLATAAREHRKHGALERAMQKQAKEAKVAKGEAIQAAETILGVALEDADGDARELLMTEVQRQMQQREQKEMEAEAYNEAKRLAFRLHKQGGDEWVRAVSAMLFNHAEALILAAEKAEVEKESK